MAQKTYEKKNYVFLYRGLAVVRDALLDFVVNCLKEAYGGEWWEKGVAPAFRPEDLEKLEIQFNKRFSNPAGPSRPGTEIYEILDINYLIMIVENKNNWKNAFAGKLNNDKTLLAYIREVILFRNPVAHPETGDLKDDDAFRGLDSGERLLRLINQDAANEIVIIKDEFRSYWVFDEVRLRNLTPEEVGVDLVNGLNLVGAAIEAKETNSSKDYQSFSMLKLSLLSNIETEKKNGFNSELGRERLQVFEKLDDLANRYLGKSFTDVCIVISPPKLSAEQAIEKVRNLKKYIKRLETELRNLELDKSLQEESHTISEYTDKKIIQKKELLEEKSKEYEKLWLEVSPNAYFVVQRHIDKKKVVEENPFTVTVTIKNVGRAPTHIDYMEELDPGIVLIDGELSVQQEILSQEVVTLTYQIYCTQPGRFKLHTQRLEYAEKVQGWDETPETDIICVNGRSPELIGDRYYQYVPSGIELVLRIKNVGNTIAHNVNVDQEVETVHIRSDSFKFAGDLFPMEEKLLVCNFQTSSLDNIRFPDTTKLIYSSADGSCFDLTLDDKFVLLEYTYPTLVEISGRDYELIALENIIDNVVGGDAKVDVVGKSRTVLIEGPEGVGKTRFIEEVINRANEKGFQCFCVNATDRIPVQQMLRQMIGLRVNEANREFIWDAVEQVVPNSGRILKQRDLVVKYLASQTEEQYDVDRLNAGIVDLVNKLSSNSPVLMVFEDAHRTPEGIETKLFQYLIKGINLTGEGRLIVCATYRPRGQALPKCFAGIDLLSYGFEKISLAPLDQQSIDEYIDKLIPFPRLNRSLRKLAYDWSGGNPLYLKEFLRHIMDTERGYVQRTGDEWYPTQTLRPDDMPENLTDIILKRVKEELGDSLGILQILSVIGIEGSWKLMMKVLHKEYPGMTEEELETKIWDLENAKFIKIKKEDDWDIDEYIFEFEHQAKREAVYNDEKSFPDTRRRRVRDLIVEVIEDPNNKIFQDEEDRIRQIARHVLKSNKNIRLERREYLRKAASIEEKRQNFNRCIEYYESYIGTLQTSHEHLRMAQAEYAIGKIYRLQGRWNECARILNRALDNLKSAQKVRDDREDLNLLYGRILAEKGGLLIKQRKFNDANEILFKARINYEGWLGQWRVISLKKKAYFYEDLVDIYLNLAEIWGKKLDITKSVLFFGSDTTSKKILHQAEVYAEKYKKYFNDKALLIKVYVHSGELYKYLKELDKATEKLEGAITLIENDGNENTSIYSQERALSLVAEIYREKGLLEKARNCYLRAQIGQERVQDFLGLGITFGGIGDLYLEEERFEDAKFYLERAYEYQKSVGDTDRIWKTCFSLFKTSLHFENLNQAGQYWQIVRMTLPDRFKELSPKEQAGIFDDVKGLADKYRSDGNVDEALRYYLDLRTFMKLDYRIAQVDIILGEIYRERKDVDNGINVVYEALDLSSEPLEQADLHFMLGDFCLIAKDHSLRSSAREHFEKSIDIYMKEGQNKEAFHAFQKFIEIIIQDREGFDDITIALNNFIDAMLNYWGKVEPRFINEAEKILLQHKRYKDAGHAYANMVAKIAYRSGDGINKVGLQPYLAKAEALYQMSRNYEDRLEGLNKLVSVYFALDAWDEIVGCYKKIFSACVDRRDAKEFIDTFRTILLLYDKLDNIYLKELVDIVNKAKTRLVLSSNQEKQLIINIAKCFHHISTASIDPDEVNVYRKLALGQYDVVIDGLHDYEIGGQKSLEKTDYNLIEVALNDSALILDSMYRRKDALQRLNRSVEIARKTENMFGEACSRANLASLLITMKEYTKAENEYEQSIKILLTNNEFWDRRIENQSNSPLNSKDIATLRFEKNWAASVAYQYGSFIIGKNSSKGFYLLNFAMELYKKQGDLEFSNRIGKTIEAFSKKFASVEPLNNVNFPIGWDAQFANDTVVCSSCGFRYNRLQIDCPQCGSRTCPNCLSLCSTFAEICPNCDTFLGVGGLKYIG